jgi:hypothetical protein
MNDFVKAFQLGQTAAEKAQADRTSIARILNKLQTEVLEATNQTIEITLAEQTAMKDLLSHATTINALLEEVPGKKRGRVLFLCARNIKVENSKLTQLAKWEEDPAGFPCRLMFGKNDLISYDGQQLEQALIKFLADPVVGEELAKISVQTAVPKN